MQLRRGEGHQRDSAPAAERRDSGRDSAERESASSPAVSDDSPPQLRRPPAAVRPGSPELRRRSSQARSRGSGGSGDSEPVVLRPKTAPASEDSELLKVFKRRSLKSRDPEDLPAAVAAELAPAQESRPSDGGQKTARPGAGDEKENEQPREETEETVVCVSVSAGGPRRPPTGRPVSAEETESPRRVSVTRRDSEVARRPSGLEEEAARPAGWLKQAVRERREQREQREQKHVRSAVTKELLIEVRPRDALVN